MDYSINFLKEKKVNLGASKSYLKSCNALFNHIRKSKYLNLKDLKTFNLNNTLKFFRKNSCLWNPGGYNSYRKIYCVFIKYLIREYKIYDFTPLFKPKKGPIRLPQLLQDNEINKILENSKESEKYIVLFFLYTGVRRFEFLALKKADIKNNYIKIQKGKGIKERLIPIHKELQKIVNKLNYNYTEYYLDMLCRKYKRLVRDFHWHRLRHTFATNLVRNGVDIYTISQLMGHSNISTTTIYLSLDLVKKAEQINKLQFEILD